MKRVLPAFALAALIHAALLTADIGWLIRHEPPSPRTEVTTLRLVDRATAALTAIRPLPAAPPSLPPAPRKPVVKKTKRAKKTPPEKKVPLPLPVKPPSELSPGPPPKLQTDAPEPEPSRPLAGKEPAQANPAITPAASLPPPPREADRETGGGGAAPAIAAATPRYNRNPAPTYPSVARKRKYQGTVMLEVFVKADGRVGDLRVIESSRYALLDRAALKAVRRWQFNPGRQGSRAVAMWVRVPIRFNLK